MIAIRPLIVDDSVVVRKTLAEAFHDFQDIGDCAVAANGRIALEMIPHVCPDVVILDMEMPTLNGLDTLRELRRTHPTLPVIMFSSLTERGAEVTIEALAIGASDYVTKPARQGNLTATINRIRDELVPKMRAICKSAQQVSPPTPPQPALEKRHHPDEPFEVLVIGGSTGGPVALHAVLSRLPRDFPLPVVIAQHMPPLFTARLAERLNQRCEISVAEADESCELRPGAALVVSGYGNAIVKQKNRSIWCEPIPAGQNALIKPSVDVLFESVAKVFGERSLALVLSGMGNDGKRGCEYIRNASGHVIVQDEESSVVWGMPGAVAKAGLADEIIPLDDIGNAVNHRIRQSTTLIPRG